MEGLDKDDQEGAYSDPSKNREQQKQQQQQQQASSSEPYCALQNLLDRTVAEAGPTDTGDAEHGGGGGSYLSELLPLGVSEPFPPAEQLEPAISDFSAIGPIGTSLGPMTGIGNRRTDHINAAPLPWNATAADSTFPGSHASVERNQYGSHSSIPFPLRQQQQQQRQQQQTQMGAASDYGSQRDDRGMLPPQQSYMTNTYQQHGSAPSYQWEAVGPSAPTTSGVDDQNSSIMQLSAASGVSSTSTRMSGASMGNTWATGATMPSANLAANAAAPLPPPGASMLAPTVQEQHRPIGTSSQQQEQELRMTQRELHIMQQQAIITEQIQQLQQLQSQLAPGRPPVAGCDNSTIGDARDAFNPPGSLNVGGAGGQGTAGHFQADSSVSFSMQAPDSRSMMATATTRAASMPTRRQSTGSSWDGHGGGAQMKPRSRSVGSSGSRSTVSSSSSTGGNAKNPAPKGPWKVDPATAFLKKRKNDKNRPKRPLSAYNLFFKDERAKMVAASRAERGVAAGAAAAAGAGESTDSSMPATAIKKVKQRSGVAFVTMAQTIAARWKSIDGHVLEEYKAAAAKDMERYRKEMEIYKQKKAGQKKEGGKSP